MTRQAFWEHVEALRKVVIRSGWTILIASLLAFCFHKQLFSLLITPLGFEKLYLLTPLEGFAASAKLSFWAGLIFSSPLWLYFVLNFFLPALKKKERGLLFPFFLGSLIFIAGGILFAYTITLPLVIKFFHTFNRSLGENLWSLSKSLDLVMSLLLAHALVFEFYMVLLLLIRWEICSYALLKKARRVMIVLILVIAAILTPPDVLSQLLLACPMLLLYGIRLLYARFRSS